jgi:hypothetical protein
MEQDLRLARIMWRKGLILLGAIFTGCLVALSAAESPATLPDRAAFARAMGQVKEGMTRDQVREILGKPDDVRGDSLLLREDSIWCYGTDGPETFPTLGEVRFNHKGTVRLAYGGLEIHGEPASPPPPSLFTEPELRTLLRLIDQTPELRGVVYDPLPVIRLVNTLQALGKERALAAIAEYLRVASDAVRENDRLFVVLRVLFDVPADPGYMPRMFVGAPWPREPKDLRRVPRFPVAIVADVPLLLVADYEIAGQPEAVGTELPSFRQHGQLRSKPLVPVADPVAVIDEFCRRLLWLYGDQPLERAGAPRKADGCPPPTDTEQGMQLAVNQILRLVKTVYRIDDEGWEAGVVDSPIGIAARWRRIEADLRKLKLRWDAVRCRYTFADGSCLPELPHYREQVWRIRRDGVCAGLRVQRRSSRTIEINFESMQLPDRPDNPKGVRLVRVAAPEKPLARFAFPVGEGGLYAGERVRLPAGEKIQAVLILADREKPGPVFEP